jgi:hypothetical protein
LYMDRGRGAARQNLSFAQWKVEVVHCEKIHKRGSQGRSRGRLQVQESDESPGNGAES